jgi:predicted RNase H-like HicB family nuclease
MATELRLRGFAEQEPDGSWYVHCVDLTLDAEAPTYEEARRKLDHVIGMYLDWASKEAKSPADVLRPSPLWFRLRYWRAIARDRARSITNWLLHRGRRTNGPARDFTTRSPVEFSPRIA